MSVRSSQGWVYTRVLAGGIGPKTLTQATDGRRALRSNQNTTAQNLQILHELRRRERAHVDAAVVVLRVERLRLRRDGAEHRQRVALRRDRAAPPAGWVARLRERQRRERAEAGLAHVRAHRADEL